MADDKIEMPDDTPSAQALGGRARADNLSPEKRSEIARTAARKRWSREAEAEAPTVEVVEDEVLQPLPSMPVAKWRGPLNIIGMEVPAYVLDNGVRVIGRTSATELLTGIRGGGALEKYLAVRALEPFINIALVLERMVPFRIPEVEGLEKAVKGLPADLVIEICQGFISALEANLGPNPPEQRMTARQQQMAVKASMFLSACAKLGLEALIDEATGYQFERSRDALQVKLAAYLEDEIRKWEKTFPDELWLEFGRLT